MNPSRVFFFVFLCVTCSLNAIGCERRRASVAKVERDSAGAPLRQADAVPTGADQPVDVARDTSDFSAVLYVRNDSVFVVELETGESAETIDLGFSFKSLDADSSVVQSASGSGRLDFIPGTLASSLYRPRPQQEFCVEYHDIAARVIGERDSSLFVKRGSLSPVTVQFLAEGEALYRQLVTVAKAEASARSDSVNPGIRAVPFTVKRVAQFSVGDTAYGVVDLLRVELKDQFGGGQQFISILRSVNGASLSVDGTFNSEWDIDGKGGNQERLLFAATDARSRPVLFTIGNEYEGESGNFYVRAEANGWKRAAGWYTGC